MFIKYFEGGEVLNIYLEFFQYCTQPVDIEMLKFNLNLTDVTNMIGLGWGVVEFITMHKLEI